MAASSSQDGNEMVEPSKPQFFKIILDQTMLDVQLRLPSKFVRKYGQSLSSSVTLEVPTGAKWKIELLKQDNDKRFEKGWKDFTNYYNLQLVSFVVFKYEGNNHFLVSVFDLSATEIDYPIGRNIPSRGLEDDGEVEPKVEAEAEAEVIVEISDDSSPSNTETEDVFPLESDHDVQVPEVRMEEMEEEAIDMSDGIPSYRPELRSPRGKAKIYESKGRDNVASRALKASVDFTSKHPFFKLVVENNHLKFNCVIVPYEIVRSKPFCQKKKMVLEVGNRRWNVKFTNYLSNKTGKISLGWLEFAKENLLEVGDVCAFELTSPHVFRVAIFKTSVGSASHSP